MKIIQSLMVMMTVMVCGTSLHCNNVLLKDIHDEAEKMCKTAPLNVRITEPSGNSTSTCVKHFFCLAEIALKNVSGEHKVHGKRLIQLLDQYNKQIHDNNCALNSSKDYDLKSFLKDIMKCSMHCSMTHKKKRSECKNMKHKQ
ncbi:hypothetical protein ABVT39_026998 [Epinephelus coioides]